MKEKIRKFQEFIHYKFKNEDLLVQSLTTPRLANETGAVSYEFLETLGDAVIKVILILKLYQKGVQDPGEITKKKAVLESDNALKKVANEINLQEFILKSGKQQIEGTRILADVFEAICGAIFVDSNQNFNLVEEKMINPVFEDLDLIMNKSPINIKSELLEFLQGKFKTRIKINLEYDESGLAHNPTWIARNPKIIDANIQKQLIDLPRNMVSGEFGNKPDAERDIYLKILKYLKNEEI
ncbi:MAG: ribonuclease III domain-containing protein [Promethearchaeota archaeon]